MLEHVIRSHRISQVAEEGGPASAAPYIGEHLTAKCGLPHPYIALTMSAEERTRRGVAENYNESRESIDEAYQAFEEYFEEQIREHRTGDARLLVLVGGCHRSALVKRFRGSGEDVLTIQFGDFERDGDCY
jgi:hypothetical protein